MNFVRHSNLEGLHAPFSASQPSWLRYDDEKDLEVLANKRAAEEGTKLHKWAHALVFHIFNSVNCLLIIFV